MDCEFTTRSLDYDNEKKVSINIYLIWFFLIIKAKMISIEYFVLIQISISIEHCKIINETFL